VKRKANITAAIACFLWGGLFLLGRDLTYGVFIQHVIGFPSAGQIDSYMVFPAIMMVLITGCAWMANAMQRWFTGLAVISALALLALLPFLFVYTGGV
jgi:hypothetical protein